MAAEATEVLAGGVANAGAVVLVGGRVRRPARPQTATVHALLRHVRDAGCTGVPEPLGVDADGHEWLGFVPGDVPVPPYPAWSRTDAALGSVAALLRRFHDATVGFRPPPGAVWDRELAGAAPGDVVGHFDVCLENVVFRHGRAVALIDFDFAAPGRRIADLASLAKRCVPVDAPEDAVRLFPDGGDPCTRLRVVADAYGLGPDRTALVDALGDQVADGGAFVRRRVEAGDPAFTSMWAGSGGQARYDRRADWFARQRDRLLDALH